MEDLAARPRCRLVARLVMRLAVPLTMLLGKCTSMRVYIFPIVPPAVRMLVQRRLDTRGDCLEVKICWNTRE